jgi:citrate lyase subunit beta/citryl-CoA lyase
MRRSMLFVPGNSPAMLLNADIHGADALIFDLEDAITPAEKDAARVLVRNAVQALGYGGCEIIIRINPLDGIYIKQDIEAMVPLRPALLMPVKVASAEEVEQISAMVAAAEIANGMAPGSVGLIPLLETASGIEHAYEIARSDTRVKAILLGAEDLTGDLQAIRSKQGDEILYARGRVVIAARAAGIDAYDTPFTDVNDEEGLEKDARFARSMGFTGKAVISPRHVAAVNAVFSPSQEEIVYARQVMAAIREGERLGKGAVSLNGRMVDKPIVDRAGHVLDAARALGLAGLSDA